MHILATFATLCCQTRWPRNHSCTTQEHVSFFRTFSGTRQKPTGQNRTFSEISTFSRFCRFCSKTEILVRTCRKTKLYLCATFQKVILLARMFSKNNLCTKVSAQVCKTQMHNSAKCSKTVVHKMRKFAAQIFFQMQILQFAQFVKCRFQISVCAQFCRV